MATASTHLDLGADWGPTTSPVRAARTRRFVRRPRYERLSTRDAFGSPSQDALRALGVPDVHR